MDKDWDSKGIANLRRLVGKGEIEKIARQLDALHNPTSIDWPAKFGLVREPRAPARSPKQPSAATTSEPAACQACHRRVSQAVIDFCEARAEVFGSRILCMDCQGKARKGRI